MNEERIIRIPAGYRVVAGPNIINETTGEILSFGGEQTEPAPPTAEGFYLHKDGRWRFQCWPSEYANCKEQFIKDALFAYDKAGDRKAFQIILESQLGIEPSENTQQGDKK